MRIHEWKKHFAKKLHDRWDRSENYVEGNCYDLPNEGSVQCQLSKIRGGGNYKIFYLRAGKISVEEINLELISENIYVDEPQYL
jgi:hypothetical protein